MEQLQNTTNGTYAAEKIGYEFKIPNSAWTLEGLQRMAKMYAKSRLFNTEEIAEICTVILYGEELGLNAIQALEGISLIARGGAKKLALSSQAIGTIIKNKGYGYKALELSNERCVLSFFQKHERNGEIEPLGEFSFTLDDAKNAGIYRDGPWRKHPKNMLFARALSNGARLLCAGALSGVPGYSEDEVEEILASKSPAPARKEYKIEQKPAPKNGDLNEKLEQLDLENGGVYPAISDENIREKESKNEK